MKRVLLGLLAAGLICLVVQTAAMAEEKDNAYLWKSHVTSMTVFKNGLGFFLRQGDVALREGWCVSDAVPPAAFGTLAIFSHKADETVDVVGSGPGEVVEFDGKDSPKDSAAKRSRLESCLFLTVQLTYTRQGKDLTSAGKLVSVGQEYVVLDTDGGSAAVPLEGIKKLQVLENPLRVHVASDSGKAPAKTTLGMAYLRKGVTWIPEYTLKLIDDDTAELTLRGTLVNEAEDLVHCDVNFVVGVPNFLHTEYLAPIAVGQIIRTIGAAVAPPGISNQMMNRSSVAQDNRGSAPGIVDMPATSGGRGIGEAVGNLPEWEGTGATDYTVYTRKDLTVRRGEKMIVTLFVKRIKYSHTYHWTPPDEVKHFLVLQNETDSAWTTGPCLAISGDNALSEDLLKYVPKGGKGEFPVTTAINITHEQKETEVDRKLKEYSPSPSFYVDLVTVSGELKLKNYGKKPAELTVDFGVKGKPVSVSDDGVIQLDTENLKLLERAASIQWKIKVGPGDTKTLTYKYERYVPSN